MRGLWTRRSRARIAVFALAAAGTLGFGAATAQAEQVIAGPIPNVFLNTSPSISRGESLTFFNLDPLAPHNVVSVKSRRRKGKLRRLFKSATVSFPEETRVRRVERLRTGSYDFICTIHPFMRGTLKVTP